MSIIKNQTSLRKSGADKTIATTEDIEELDSEKTTLTAVKADADISSAISLKHTQNTDSGTTGNTFTIDSDSSTGKIVIDVALNAGEDHTMTITNAVMTDDKTITIPAITDTLVTKTSADTLTNKRNTLRVDGTTSAAQPTINTDNVDIYRLSAQTADITSFTANLSGSASEGDMLLIEITGTGARAIAWGVKFAATTIALPTSTVTTAQLRVLFKYNTVTQVWDCVGVV